mmetsp:Transcript_14298/g.21469  ORF Transcript_14298/g.21469 Transcript_14298/m.21469 type:complete len:168 (-) Transcript_14298:16-519(-)
MRVLRVLIFLTLCLVATAQFGVNKKDEIAAAAAAGQQETETQEAPVTRLTEQDALDIGALIEAAGQDPETIKLVAALKDQNAGDIAELKNLPAEEILNELKGALDEMKMLDLLFKDPAKAVELFEAEGLLPPEHLEKYKKEPELLEDDTRKGLYFRFISLAVVGDYL